MKSIRSVFTCTFLDDILRPLFVCLRVLESWFVCVCQRDVKSSPPSAQLDRNSEASTPGLQLFDPNALASNTHTPFYRCMICIEYTQGPESFLKLKIVKCLIINSLDKNHEHCFVCVCLRVRECLGLCIHWFFWCKSLGNTSHVKKLAQRNMQWLS